MKPIAPLLLLFICHSAFAQFDSLDLRLTALTLSSSKTEVKKGVTFSFRLENSGLIDFPSELTDFCRMEAVLSADTVPDPDDTPVQSFSFPFDALAPAEESIYESSLFIPSGYPAGKYYLIVSADFGSCLTFKVEDVRNTWAPLEIVPFTGYPCNREISKGSLQCSYYDPQGFYHVVVRDGAALKSFRIDGAGAATPDPDPADPQEFVWTVEQNAVVKKDRSGAVIYNKPIPQALVSDYFQINNAIEIDGGFILSAFKNPTYYPVPFAPNTAQLDLTLIKTTGNFTVQTSRVFQTTNDARPFLLALDTQRFAFGFGTVSTGFTNGYLQVLNLDLQTGWSQNVVQILSNSSGYGISSPSVSKTPCGDFVYGTYLSSNYLPIQSSSTSGTHYATWDGEGFSVYKSYYTRSDYGSVKYASSGLFDGPAPGGGRLHAEFETILPASYALGSSELTLTHTQGNQTIFEKKLVPQQLYPFRELVFIGGKYFLAQQTNEPGVLITPVDCDNSQPLVVSVREPFEHDGPKVSASPNPCHDRVTLRGVSGKCAVTIYSLTGAAVFSRLVETGESGTFEVSLAGLPAGTYIGRVQQDAGFSAFHLVVH